MSAPEVTLPSPDLPEWTGDGCDRCGHAGSDAYIAKAQVRFTLPSGLTLTMCGHHGRVMEAELLERGARVEHAPHGLGAD